MNPLYDPRYENPHMTLASALCHYYGDNCWFNGKLCPFNKDALAREYGFDRECLIGRWGSGSSAHMKIMEAI